jgi:hypothetical protein
MSMINLMRGDCLELIKLIPDGSTKTHFETIKRIFGRCSLVNLNNMIGD